MEVELSMSSDVRLLDAEGRAQMKRWLGNWKRLGPILEQERWDRIDLLRPFEDAIRRA